MGGSHSESPRHSLPSITDFKIQRRPQSMVLRKHKSTRWTPITMDTVSPACSAVLTHSPADDAPSSYAPPPGAPPSRNEHSSYQSTEEKERSQIGSSPYPDHSQSQSSYPSQGQYGQQQQQQPQKKGLGGLFDKLKGAAAQAQQGRPGGGMMGGGGGMMGGGGYGQQQHYPQQGYGGGGYGQQGMMGGGYGQQPMMGGGMMGGGYGQQGMMQPRRQGMGAGGAVRLHHLRYRSYADLSGCHGCRRWCKSGIVVLRYIC
jgi:hypothetical protein